MPTPLNADFVQKKEGIHTEAYEGHMKSRERSFGKHSRTQEVSEGGTEFVFQCFSLDLKWPQSKYVGLMGHPGIPFEMNLLQICELLKSGDTEERRNEFAGPMVSRKPTWSWGNPTWKVKATL